jgi:hypothetical protein
VEATDAYRLGEDWFRDLGMDPDRVPRPVQLRLWLEGPREEGLLF